MVDVFKLTIKPSAATELQAITYKATLSRLIERLKLLSAQPRLTERFPPVSEPSNINTKKTGAVLTGFAEADPGFCSWCSKDQISQTAHLGLQSCLLLIWSSDPGYVS
jgi:hypothetical protein